MYKTLYTVLVSFLTISVATGLTAAEYKGPNLSGQTVSIAGPWLTGDEENFDKVNAYFEKATGAKVDYAGSDSFEQQIVIDIKAGSPPNLAAFPQPGLAANMAAIGGLVPLGDDMETGSKTTMRQDRPGWILAPTLTRTGTISFTVFSTTSTSSPWFGMSRKTSKQAVMKFQKPWRN